MTDPLAVLRTKFIARCAEDLLVVQAGPAAPDLPRVIHRIAGVAGMFGFTALGELAGRIDERAHAGQGFSEAELAELAAALDVAARN